MLPPHVPVGGHAEHQHAERPEHPVEQPVRPGAGGRAQAGVGEHEVGQQPAGGRAERRRPAGAGVRRAGVPLRAGDERGQHHGHRRDAAEIPEREAPGVVRQLGRRRVAARPAHHDHPARSLRPLLRSVRRPQRRLHGRRGRPLQQAGQVLGHRDVADDTAVLGGGGPDPPGHQVRRPPPGDRQQLGAPPVVGLVAHRQVPVRARQHLGREPVRVAVARTGPVEPDEHPADEPGHQDGHPQHRGEDQRQRDRRHGGGRHGQQQQGDRRHQQDGERPLPVQPSGPGSRSGVRLRRLDQREGVAVLPRHPAVPVGHPQPQRQRPPGPDRPQHAARPRAVERGPAQLRVPHGGRGGPTAREGDDRHGFGVPGRRGIDAAVTGRARTGSIRTRWDRT